VIVSEEKVREALGPLPPAALRIEEEVAATLFHLGIETIEQLLGLPRAALPARFGAGLLGRIDQALGRVSEPLTPLEYQAPIEARMDFDGVIGQIETIWLTIKQLIERIVIELKHRGAGARKVRMQFFQAYGPAIEKTITLSRPSRDGGKLFNLMRCAMEGGEENDECRMMKDESPNSFASASALGTRHSALSFDPTTSNDSRGYVGVRLAVLGFERISDEQIPLMQQEEHDGQVELDSLIERLALRLGEERVARARLAESYLPEKAYTWHGLPARGSDSRAGSPCHIRPLMLFPRPVEARVMVSPSDDRDGRPISITQDGKVRRVMHAVGPERIAGQWWEGHNKTRDYFAVEDEEGRRSWVFRVRETGRWFVHGEFE
jgi:protein ImuB